MKIKIIVAVLAITALIAVYASGILNYFQLDNIRRNLDFLNDFTRSYYLQSVLIYILVYILLILTQAPLGWILTMVGGYLYGLWSIIYINIAIAIGCTLVFLFVRYLIGDWVQKKYHQQLETFNQHLKHNEISYLLTLRLMPIFPFFFINGILGVTKVSLWSYIWTTCVGTLFGTFVYALAGSKLASIENPTDVFSPEIILAFMTLIVLSFSPIFYTRWKQRGN